MTIPEDHLKRLRVARRVMSLVGESTSRLLGTVTEQEELEYIVYPTLLCESVARGDRK
jgi:hypothetical protein